MNKKRINRVISLANDDPSQISDEPSEIWTNLGFSLLNLDQYDKAIEILNKALEIAPNNDRALILQGCALNFLEKYEKARESLSKASQINPEAGGLWNNLGISFFYLKQYKESIESFDKALKIHPDSCELWHFRGRALEFLDKHEEARICYNKALEIKPDYDQALFSRAEIYSHLNKYQEALDDYEAGMKLQSDSHEVSYILGAISLLKSNYIEACKYLQNAIQGIPHNLKTEEKNEYYGIYYVALGMENMSKGLSNKAEELLLKGASFYKNTDKAGKEFGYNITAFAEIASVDYKFEKSVFTGLLSFQKAITETVKNLKKIKEKSKEGFLNSIISSKFQYFLAIKNALDFKKITLNVIKESEKILSAQKIQNKDIISDYREFFAFLEGKKESGITDITQLSEKDCNFLLTLIKSSLACTNDSVLINEAQKCLEEFVKGQVQKIQACINSAENRIHTNIRQNAKDISDKIEITYWDPKSDFTPYIVKFEGNNLDKCVMKVDSWSIPFSRDQLLQAVVVAIYMKYNTKPVKERCLSDLMIGNAITNAEWQNADKKSDRHIYWIFKSLKEKLASKKYNLNPDLFTKTSSGWCIFTLPQNITISEDLENLLINSESILPRNKLIALKDNS